MREGLCLFSSLLLPSIWKSTWHPVGPEQMFVDWMNVLALPLMGFPNWLVSRWKWEVEETDPWRGRTLIVKSCSGYCWALFLGWPLTRCCSTEVQNRLQLMVWSKEGLRAQNVLTSTSSSVSTPNIICQFPFCPFTWLNLRSTYLFCFVLKLPSTCIESIWLVVYLHR